jgi:hypothetical protein
LTAQGESTNICLVSNQILPKVAGAGLKFSLVHNLDIMREALKEFVGGSGVELCKTFIVFLTERRDLEIYQVDDVKL